MKTPIINWGNASAVERQDYLRRPAITNNGQLYNQVSDIIRQVTLHSDKALFDLTEKFDGIKLNTLEVSTEQVNTATSRLTETRLNAIHKAHDNITKFHSAQKFNEITVETTPGVICSLKSEAIESVGLYIPAGSAPLPSTVLMLGVPAKLAGCKRVVLVCPPDKNGRLSDEVLAAAKVCGITEIYTVGGAQAIAALARGTDSIKPVNKVFGPGNSYVTEAKKQLSQLVPGFAIDMPAGPSEVLVLADNKANPAFIAADLLSQAEHGPDSQVILITDSQKIIDDTQVELEKQLAQLSRKDVAERALSHSRLILTESIEQAVEVSNLYGPEHLIVQTDNASSLLSSLRNAGSIFVGAYTPESAGDYASGTNHVLPTYGYSKVISSLSLADFSRRFTVQEITRSGLQNLAECIIELTDAEGLDAHQRAVTIRLEADSDINSESEQ